MDEKLKETMIKIFEEHIDCIPEEIKPYIHDDDFYNVDNTWAVMIILFILFNNDKIKKEDDK